jgi:hypothetical protein
MKNKELKTLWKVAKSFWISGTILWILETAIFLLYEGWHLKATDPIEMFLDKIVSEIWTFALWLTIFVCFHYVINLNKKRSN